MRHRVAGLILLLLLLVAGASLVLPVAASPQPTPVCSACGKPFQEAAGGVTVQESTVLVRVHENGSATWTVRNRLSSGAEVLRENPDDLDTAARVAVRRGEGPSEGLRPVDARMENDTAVLVFRDDDAARRHAGLLVVQYFHERGYEYRYHLNADTFTFRAPPGAVVTNDPPGASVDGRNATFRGETHDRQGAGEALGEDAYVVFGPDRSALTGARTTTAVGLATAPIVLRSFSRFALVQSLVFAGVLLIVVRLVRQYGDALDVRGLAAVAVLATGGLVAGGVVLGLGSIPAPTAVVLALVSLAALPRARRHLATPGRQALAALLAVGVGYLVALSVAPTRGGFGALLVAAVALPFGFAFPFGGALAGPDRRNRLAWGMLPVAGFAVAMVAVVGPTDPPQGLAGGVFAMITFVGAVVVPVLAAPVVALGYSLARRVRSP